MMTAERESTMREPTPLHGRASDFLRQAAHVSHEARLLKSVAIDAVEDGVYAARRTMKRARRQALGARDELIVRVKREPIKALAIAVGVGALVGLSAGLARRFVKPCASETAAPRSGGAGL